MEKQVRGRPRVEEKVRFKNVALIDDSHDKLREMAELNERTMTRELKIIINKEYDRRFVE
jgi:hypothetical protein|tara:strand:- start:386 stop:565 length:180 start_codon:yes stop_codon:yes gene_type:complete